MPAMTTLAPAEVEVEQPRGGDEFEHDRPWVVIVWNDPINLMSYVTLVFQKLFGYSKAKATKLMLQVHNEGKAVVSTGSREKAEHDVARLHGARALGDDATGLMWSRRRIERVQDGAYALRLPTRGARAPAGAPCRAADAARARARRPCAAPALSPRLRGRAGRGRLSGADGRRARWMGAATPWSARRDRGRRAAHAPTGAVVADRAERPAARARHAPRRERGGARCATCTRTTRARPTWRCTRTCPGCKSSWSRRLAQSSPSRAAPGAKTVAGPGAPRFASTRCRWRSSRTRPSLPRSRFSSRPATTRGRRARRCGRISRARWP